MKKGYTLVEVLAVLGLLGIILLITTASYNAIVRKTRTDVYNRQVNTIIQVGKDWALKNVNDLSKENENIVLLEELLNQGYLDAKEVINPKTEEAMQGCVIITWNESYQQYNYTYQSDNTLCEK